MAEISLCMIVKNEEENLADCLDCVAGIVDEINIVDTGSTDKTIEIAKSYTDRVYHFEWVDDFAAARNFSYSKATKDFIMWLDADDIITDENSDKLLILKSRLNDSIDFIIAHYRMNNADNSNAIFPKVRITRRAANISWRRAIHENLQMRGNGLTVDLYVDHKYKESSASSERNLRILKKEVESGRADPVLQYYYGMDLFFMNDYDGAEQYLGKVAESGDTPEFDPIEMYVALHKIYLNHGDLVKARAILEDNERLMSDKSEYYCLLGDFYMDCLHDTNKAIDMYKQALNCKGSYTRKEIPEYRKMDYYYFMPNLLLGKVYFSLNDTETALEYFDKALVYRKNDEIDLLSDKFSHLTQQRKRLMP